MREPENEHLARRASSSVSRRPLLFAAGFVAVTLAVMLWPAIDPGLRTFYERTIALPGRPRLAVQHLGTGPIAGTAARRDPRRHRQSCRCSSPSVPRKKSLVQVAALGAALLIALQLTMHHWFYLYIVWFYPLLLVAMAAVTSREPRRRRREPAPARSSRPVPVWLTSTTAPITQTSSSAVSKRVGIWVISDAERLLRLDPEHAGPRPGHADVGDERGPLRQHPGVGGRHVGVGAEAPRRPGRRGASPSPPSRWSPRRGSRRSTASASTRSRMRVDGVEGRARDLQPDGAAEVDHRDPHPARLDHGVAAARVAPAGSWPAGSRARSRSRKS